MSRWLPHVTVAAVIEQAEQFLMVEEEFEGYTVFNQPEGHLEKDENLIEAISREVLIETGWQFTPEYLVGIYQYIDLYTHQTYIRFSFGGKLGNHEPERIIESQIKSVTWLSKEKLADEKLRNSVVLRSIHDYLSEHRMPMDFISFI